MRRFLQIFAPDGTLHVEGFVTERALACFCSYWLDGTMHGWKLVAEDVGT